MQDIPRKRTVAVYCGSSPGASPLFGEIASRFGTWLGQNGFNVVYGGSSVGLMGRVSRAALDAGAEVIGVEPQFFIDAGVEQHDLSELRIVRTMSERKAAMIAEAREFVALPGGVGTLEEISEIMARIHLHLDRENRIDPSYLLHCYLLNLNGFYDGLRELLDTMLDTGFMIPDTYERIHFPNALESLQEQLLQRAPQ